MKKTMLLALALGTCSLYAQATLRSLAAERGRYVGSILNSEWFGGSTMEGYEDLHKAQFNLVVAENEMKFDALHTAKDTYSWTKADKLMAYAEENGMRVRGHALAWHSQVPGWVTSGAWTRETLLAVLKDHISTVVGHYKGRIHEWDVVNEAITDDAVRGWRGISSGTSIWASTIGPDFIDSAFVWAHAADPDAELYYNDYAIEWGVGKDSKAAFLLEACKKWKASGIPITGVGTQTHIAVSHTQTPAKVKALADSLKALGLKLQITELDIGFPQGTTPTLAQLEAQVAGQLAFQHSQAMLESAQAVLDSAGAHQAGFYGRGAP